MKRLILILLIALFPCNGVAGWLGPSNYDECILQNMKGVTSERAATAIVGACRRKFPEVKEKPVLKEDFSNIWEVDAYYREEEERGRAAGRLKK